MIVEDAHHIVTTWIKKYSATFFNYLYTRVGDKTAAKDILQETFIAAWKNSSRFKNESSEKTWLSSILKNKLSDHYRIQGRLMTDLHDNNYFFDEADHWTETAAPKQWEDAAASLNKKEFYLVLDQCKTKLTRVQQLAFSMKYIDEHKPHFICKVLQITTSNYWVIIHRCKLQLRSCLEKNWFLNDTK
ncbi:MAG: sigma-70 family RNA polymerase sigma factor [Ginsengibacter sp.]